MLIGYSRTSTADQKYGLEAQIEELNAAGCLKVYSEQVSSVSARRAQLDECLEFIRSDDVLVVTKLDRLARSIRHLCEIIDLLERKGVSLRILSMGIDTATPTGRLILTLMGGIAEWEREIIRERQIAGISRAKAEGKYKGRAPTAMRQTKEALDLREEGMSVSQIAEKLAISKRSVYRIWEQHSGH